MPVPLEGFNSIAIFKGYECDTHVFGPAPMIIARPEGGIFVQKIADNL